MPTLLIWRGHKFRFYSSDGLEPPHVHVYHDRKSVKIWLKSMSVVNNKGYSDQEINRLLAIVKENRKKWMEAWNEFFGI